MNEVQEMFDSVGINDLDPKRKEMIALLESYGLDSYYQKRDKLREAFLIMNDLPNDSYLRKWLESLIKKSMLYGQRINDEVYIRRHNTFVQHYVLRLNKWAIRQNQSIDGRTVFKDINFILDKMMIFTYGIDALNPKKDEQIE